MYGYTHFIGNKPGIFNSFPEGSMKHRRLSISPLRAFPPSGLWVLPEVLQTWNLTQLPSATDAWKGISTVMHSGSPQSSRPQSSPYPSPTYIRAKSLLASPWDLGPHSFPKWPHLSETCPWPWYSVRLLKRATPTSARAKPYYPLALAGAHGPSIFTPSRVSLPGALALPTYLGPGTAAGVAPARPWPGQWAARRRRPWLQPEGRRRARRAAAREDWAHKGRGACSRALPTFQPGRDLRGGHRANGPGAKPLSPAPHPPLHRGASKPGSTRCWGHREAPAPG